MRIGIKRLVLCMLVIFPVASIAMTLEDAVKEANLEEISRIYSSKAKHPEVSCVTGGVTEYGISCLYSYGVSHLQYDEKYRGNGAEIERRIMKAADIMTKAGARAPIGDSLYSLIVYGYARAFEQAVKLGASVMGENIGGSNLNVCQIAHSEGHPEVCEIAKRHGHRGISSKEIVQLQLTKAISELDIYAIDAAIEAGADISMPAPNGESALYTATDVLLIMRPEDALKQSQVIKYLISRGAKPDSVYGKYGIDSPLHHAITKSPGLYAKYKFDEAPLLKIVAALINAGAEISGRDSLGNTPLHYAAKNGLVSTVKFLLLAGAYPLSKNEKSQTPIDIAGKNEIIVILRNIGNGGNVPASP